MNTTPSTCIAVRGVYKIFGAEAERALALSRQGMGKKEVLARTGCNVGLRNVSLDIPSGQIFCIMGLSGSGKSTLVRHFNRLIEPSAGEILLNGHDVLKLNEADLRQLRRQTISMVFQGFGLLPHKTVLENVVFGLLSRGDVKEASLQKARQWIDRVGLAGYEAKYPDELSGGMRQKLGFVLAIVHAPRLVLLDEPPCFDPLAIDVAVITGDYDRFDLVLDNMGFANYELIDGLTTPEVTDFLGNLEGMQQYDIIFFNGGLVEEGVFYSTDGSSTEHELYLENIREYVRGGGSVYASDWAYDVIERTWPDRLDFVGDDAVPDAAQLGEYDLVTANISDAALSEWLGLGTLDVEYDLPVWPPVEAVEGSVSVHMRGSVEYRLGTERYSLVDSPLLVSFASGEGRVGYSTFRVARNASVELNLVLQYMMYNL
jgi:glycine betaine/proline transport system ATP-binding protein